MDPTNLSRTCTKALSDANVNSNGTPTGITSGCMKFYIYDNSGGTYKMILDHNTSGNTAWAGTDDYIAAGGIQADYDAGKYNIKGPVTANKRIQEDTTGWIGGPRLITADEIAHILGADLDSTIKWKSNKTYAASPSDINTQVGYYFIYGNGNASLNTYSTTNGWNFRNATNTSNKIYAWLFDYMRACSKYGCRIEDPNVYAYPTKTSSTTHTIDGYWVNTSVTGSNSDAWVIKYGAQMGVRAAGGNNLYGVRPVIEVPKSVID